MHLHDLVCHRSRARGLLDEAEDATPVTIEDVRFVAATAVRVLVRREGAREIDDALTRDDARAIVTRLMAKRDKLHGRTL